MSTDHRAFTLVELLVVIAIISLLAALIFPVFASVKRSAKGASCLSNVRQIEQATLLYLADCSDVYPQTRQTLTHPEVDNADGNLDEPVYQPATRPLLPYASRAVNLFACPEDPDVWGRTCLEQNPDAPEVNSYLVNGYFVFGLAFGSLEEPASVIHLAERSGCNDIYHPWIADEMNVVDGMIATDRHNGKANYGFADGHTKLLKGAEAYSSPLKNLHNIR